MNRLDRYFLAQLMAPFGFFSLVIVGILWLAQALPLVDKVIESGQSGLVFLEITSLLIPRVLMVAVPFAGFGAALFALNRLYTEAELVVMMTAGQSPFALARPVLIFGTFVMMLMAVTTLYLVPASQTQLHSRLQAIQAELAGTLLKEGEFIHLNDDITIFIRDTSRIGEMAGLFLHDQSDPDNPITYSASKAQFLQDDEQMRIVMVDGLIQHFNAKDQTLNVISFDRFSYDLSSFLFVDTHYNRTPFEMYFHELINPTPEMLASDTWWLGDYTSEAHHKLTIPISALALPLIALATILVGGFRRGGFMRRVFVAIVIGVSLQSAVIVTKSIVQQSPDLFWIMYVPSLAGFGIAWYFLYSTGRIRHKAPKVAV